MNELNLSEHTQNLLSRKNITELFVMQIEVANKVLRGDDLAFRAPTGSGKTLAYLLPILQMLYKTDKEALIIVPNGEIAAQISQLVDYFKEPDISSLTLSESGNAVRQKEKLKKKRPRLMIATLKRLNEFYQQRLISFDKLTQLVLDEADLLFIGDKIEVLEKIIKKIPSNCQRILSSATLTKEQVDKFEIARVLEWLDYGTLPEGIKHYRYKTSSNKQEIALAKLIKVAKISKALIFVNSTSHTSHLKVFLNENKLPTEDFSSFKDKLQRKRALEKLRDGAIRFVITTDSLARGIDIDDVDVINYMPARDMNGYIHRSGRTGRAHKKGGCYNMVTSKNYFVLDKIAKALSLEIIDL